MAFLGMEVKLRMKETKIKKMTMTLKALDRYLVISKFLCETNF